MTALVQPNETVSFPVEGMTCASCVNRITRFLNKVDGVVEPTSTWRPSRRQFTLTRPSRP